MNIVRLHAYRRILLTMRNMITDLLRMVDEDLRERGALPGRAREEVID